MFFSPDEGEGGGDAEPPKRISKIKIFQNVNASLCGASILSKLQNINFKVFLSSGGPAKPHSCWRAASRTINRV